MHQRPVDVKSHESVNRTRRNDRTVLGSVCFLHLTTAKISATIYLLEKGTSPPPKMEKKQKDNSISAALHGWYRQALKHTKYRWIVNLGTQLYLDSPLDISPDDLPILGWNEDGVIVSLLVTEVSQIISEELKRKRRFSETIKTEVETVLETDDVKTITVDAVTVS